MLRFLIPVLFLFSIDLYSYQAFKAALGNELWLRGAFWGVHLVVYALILLSFWKYEWIQSHLPRIYGYWFFSFVVALYVPKLLLILFLAVEDVSRIGKWVWTKWKPDTEFSLSRSKFLNRAALLAAGIPFVAMAYGILKGKYDYTLHKVRVPLKNLPPAFEGMTITQISDLHTGSFDSKAAVRRGLEMVNAQQSDYIFFTGDLINMSVTELDGYTDIYSSLKAKEGVFSVLGNHDYADYVHWDSAESKQQHLEKVKQAHADYGWRLLINEHVMVEKEGQKLAIIGVENWGARRGFPKYGKMAEACEGVEEASVKLLLSHDPSHWDAEICKKYPQIDLTFSGHTHGFQFGIEIPWLKWSPIQYAYKQWAGLYQSDEQYLYVNRGFGFLGFSGRVGIKPEITVIELVRA